ncbi:MAG: ABC transporter substrate-binding protein [Spirochaetaceae bacterium]
MRKTYILVLCLLTLLGSPLLFASGEKEQVMDKGPIIVASKMDTEGSLLGQMIISVLEKDGFEVVDNTSLGATKINREAIINGETDIYPEYTGNGAFFLASDYSPETWKNSKKGYEAVKQLDYDANKIIWLHPSPANNTWAIAMQGKLAKEEGLKTLSDLAKYINNGGVFKIVGSQEFVSSDAALPAFEKAYGFKLESKNLLVLAGGNTAQTEQAAARGTDGVNAAMAYGTDGQIAALGLVVLEDNLGIQPVYLPVPIIREEVLLKYPEIEKLLKPVFDSLDLVTLQKLNGMIAVDGLSAADVAVEYLQENKFIK